MELLLDLLIWILNCFTCCSGADGARYGLRVSRHRVYIAGATARTLRQPAAARQFRNRFSEVISRLDVSEVLSLPEILASRKKRDKTCSIRVQRMLKSAKKAKSTRDMFKRGRDTYVACQYSEKFGPHILQNKVPTITPNAKIWSHRLSAFLDGDDHCALQGMLDQASFPFLAEARAETLKRNLAGNSFSAGHFMAGVIALFDAAAAGVSAATSGTSTAESATTSWPSVSPRISGKRTRASA